MRIRKRFTLFISNEDMDNIKFVKLLENSRLLIDGTSETAKHQIKSKNVDFFLL